MVNTVFCYNQKHFQHDNKVASKTGRERQRYISVCRIKCIRSIESLEFVYFFIILNQSI